MKKKQYQMLRKGLETIATEYSNFLQDLQKKSETLQNPQELHLLSMETEEILKNWLKEQLSKIQSIFNEKKHEPTHHENSLKLFKEYYDKILHAGTCATLLGKSPKIVTKSIPAFELFSAYHSFLNAGLCEEISKKDIDLILKDTEEFLNIDTEEEKESFRYLNKMKDKINDFEEENEEKKDKYLIFKQEVIKNVKIISNLIKATREQKDLILEKAKEILNKFISKAKKNEVIIRKDVNSLTNAGAIIYAVIISNQNMPEISALKISKMIGTHDKAVYKLYKNWYKDLVNKKDFNFQYVQLGRSRRILSLYLFKLFNGTENEISELILRLKKIEVLNLVSQLKRSFTTTEVHELLTHLKKEEIETYQDMAVNYPDTFNKFFSDLIEIIKLLIISNKTHKIIGADFSLIHFTKFLMENDINLCLNENGLVNVITDIFKFLRKYNYDHFPSLMRESEKSTTDNKRIDRERREVVGNRIKLFVMKHIYKGKYFDDKNGITVCPDCLNEGFIINTTFPRIRSKEFHHEDIRIEGYEARELFSLFVNDRGNPYFLQDLIKKMEDESVVLKCGSHHSIVSSIYFNYFKKLISWENIPDEFPYKDIFDLPAEIINILVMICVEELSFPDLNELSNHYSIYGIRGQIVYFLKKRYIIDRIYGGVCPCCGEFNTRDHLPSFEFNHLNDFTMNKRKVPNLYLSPCSKLVKELEKEVGAFICRNCHFVIHNDISRVDNIYDDQNIINEVIKDYRNTIRNYKQKLINTNKSIKNPLTSEITKYKALKNYLIAIYEISKEKEVVNNIDLMNKMGKASSTINDFFKKRKNLLEKYGRIIDGKITQYYMNHEGKRIIRLIYYFRDYYRNLLL